MQEFEIPSKSNKVILALGAESAGNFSIFKKGEIFFSEDFGDLQDEKNFKKYKLQLNKFLKEKSIDPDIVISDLHPLFKTTELTKKLAKKYEAEYIPIQHHLAHIFSAVGEKLLEAKSYKLEAEFIGIACDGTGYGLDEKIWGGEIFKISSCQFPISNKPQKSKVKIERIGHLENQILIGGELAIKEPARLIISIINKFPNSNFQFPINFQSLILKNKKELAFHLVKEYYNKNEFELLWNQLQQNFNCIETSSTARVLDAVSVLLGFSKNESLEKHGPVKLLEENSSTPYEDLKPKINNLIIDHHSSAPNINNQPSTILDTTYLFEYLIRNLEKDKKRLATTAQKYIAEGLMEIVKQSSVISHQSSNIYFSGGMANNKIITDLMEKQNVYMNKKISRGDAGISFGQIVYHLTNSRH